MVQLSVTRDLAQLTVQSLSGRKKRALAAHLDVVRIPDPLRLIGLYASFR